MLSDKMKFVVENEGENKPVLLVLLFSFASFVFLFFPKILGDTLNTLTLIKMKWFSKKTYQTFSIVVIVQRLLKKILEIHASTKKANETALKFPQSLLFNRKFDTMPYKNTYLNTLEEFETFVTNEYVKKRFLHIRDYDLIVGSEDFLYNSLG